MAHYGTSCYQSGCRVVEARAGFRLADSVCYRSKLVSLFFPENLAASEALPRLCHNGKLVAGLAGGPAVYYAAGMILQPIASGNLCQQPLGHHLVVERPEHILQLRQLLYVRPGLFPRINAGKELSGVA